MKGAWCNRPFYLFQGGYRVQGTGYRVRDGCEPLALTVEPKVKAVDLELISREDVPAYMHAIVCEALETFCMCAWGCNSAHA